MTNPLAIESTVHAGRAAAERLMVDTVTITRTTSLGAINDTTGAYTPTSSTVYSGKARVKLNNVADLVVDAGGRGASVREYIVSVPLSSTVFAVDDTVTITASALDPAQVGLVLHVLGITHGSQITARRLRCQEVTS